MPLLKSLYNNGGAYSAGESLDVARLRITDGGSDGVVIAWSASDQLTIDAAVANDSIQVGSTTATDVQFHGANSIGDVIFDASVDALQRGSSSFLVPCYATAVHQSLSGPGAMSLTASYTRWTTTGADAGTLAAPGTAVPPGFIKTIQMVADGGDGTLTVTGLAAANDVWTFNEIGHYITLMAVNSTTWILLKDGVGDTTVGTMPSFA